MKVFDQVYLVNLIICKKFFKYKEGVVEIWLTSEDTGAYGKDIGTTIVELLWKIVEVIPEGKILIFKKTLLIQLKVVQLKQVACFV